MTSENEARILAVSDIHGSLTRFKQLLEKARYDPARDRLIVCGDLVDRGGENVAMLNEARALRQGGAVFLKGNHEQFLESGLREMLENPRWRRQPSPELAVWYGCNGGEATLRELDRLAVTELAALLLFVQSLPTYCERGHYIFSHAGFDPRWPLDAQSENDFVWATRDFYAAPALPGRIAIFGHTPTFCLPGAPPSPDEARVWRDAVHGDKLGIDCGCVYGGRLACLELPSQREFYA